MRATLNCYNPRNKIVRTETGFTYLDTTSVITGTIEIFGNNDIEIFEQFYKLNNRLKYCFGSHYEFMHIGHEVKYNQWLKSDDYREKSFSLFYGNGTVD